MVHILKLAMSNWESGIVLILLLMVCGATITGSLRIFFNYLGTRQQKREKCLFRPPEGYNCRCKIVPIEDERAGMDLPEHY